MAHCIKCGRTLKMVGDTRRCAGCGFRYGSAFLSLSGAAALRPVGLLLSPPAVGKTEPEEDPLSAKTRYYFGGAAKSVAGWEQSDTFAPAHEENDLFPTDDLFPPQPRFSPPPLRPPEKEVPGWDMSGLFPAEEVLFPDSPRAAESPAVVEDPVADKPFDIRGSILKSCKVNDEVIVIPDGVETVSAFAFYGLKVKKIVLSAGVKSIENYAFCNCTELQEVDLGDASPVIGPSAFDNTPFAKTLKGRRILRRHSR